MALARVPVTNHIAPKTALVNFIFNIVVLVYWSSSTRVLCSGDTLKYLHCIVHELQYTSTTILKMKLTSAVLGAMWFVTGTLASAIGLENTDELETSALWPTFDYKGKNLRYGCSGGYCWRDKPAGSWCWT